MAEPRVNCAAIIEQRGLYLAVCHEPDPRSGNGVVRFVFRAKVRGGELSPSESHPVLGFYRRDELVYMREHGAELAESLMEAVDLHRERKKYDAPVLSTIFSHRTWWS